MRYFAIVVLFILIVIYNIKQDSTTTVEVNSTILNKSQTKLLISKKESQKEVIKKSTSPKSNRANQAINIFKELDIDRLRETLPTKKDIEPIFAVEISKNGIRNLNRGDKIVLPYIDGVEYEAKVVKKIFNDNGSVSIVGKILDIQDSCSIVLSEGKRYSFGTINLPNRSFEMEFINGRGYIYSVKDIDNGWIDYSKDDSIEPSI